MKKYSKLNFTLAIILFTTILAAYPLTKVHAATSSVSIRLSGADRYETSVKIAQSGWTSSNYAVIATGDDFPDALCAAPLAKKINAPILLTNKKTLNAYTKLELKRLKVTDVTIIGGVGAVSQNVENQIKALGINITRIEGVNRYETSKKVAQQLGTSSEIVIATGENFPDALSIASIAAANKMPILLTKKLTLASEIKDYISSNNPRITYVVGGTGVIAESQLSGLKNPIRLSGSNRYDTNVAVLKKFSSQLNVKNIFIATGTNFPDALATSALVALSSSPLLLTSYTPNTATKMYIANNRALITTCTSIGGVRIVPNALAELVIAGNKPVNTQPKNPFPLPNAMVPKNTIFAIDIGHNTAYDGGAVGIRKEDECAKEVGLLVISKLTKLGYIAINCSPKKVVTSTTNSLQQRCDIANAAKANIFAAIHFNCFNGTARGSEVFAGSSTTQKKAKLILKNLEMLGYVNRGVKDNSRHLYVLSHTKMPSMLIECSFIDSASDMDRYNASKIADAIVNGLIRADK